MQQLHKIASSIWCILKSELSQVSVVKCYARNLFE